jgi:hypothetical protein
MEKDYVVVDGKEIRDESRLTKVVDMGISGSSPMDERAKWGRGGSGQWQ